jgi:hypothetical protein
MAEHTFTTYWLHDVGGEPQDVVEHHTLAEAVAQHEVNAAGVHGVAGRLAILERDGVVARITGEDGDNAKPDGVEILYRRAAERWLERHPL